MYKGKKRWLVGIAAAALAALAWLAAAAAWLLLDPTLAQWTLIVTVAAVATEAALWVGAVILGISSLQRLRSWRRLRHGPPADAAGSS